MASEASHLSHTSVSPLFHIIASFLISTPPSAPPVERPPEREGEIQEVRRSARGGGIDALTFAATATATAAARTYLGASWGGDGAAAAGMTLRDLCRRRFICSGASPLPGLGPSATRRVVVQASADLNRPGLLVEP